MKKIATATIATAGFATIAFAGHDAHAAEQNNAGYNPNDAQSYSYTYTIDAQGNYHYKWTGNFDPSQLEQNNTNYYYNNYGYTNYNNYNNYSYNYNNYNNYNNYSQNTNNYNNYSQNTNNYNNYSNYNYSYNNQASSNSQRTGGLGASYNATSNNVHVTSTSAPSSNGQSVSTGNGSANNLYTSGQCTYYVFDRVGGKIGSTWGNANNWANAAARSGYTVNNTPKAGAIMQTSQGTYGHVAYVESVNSNGSVKVSEMNYGHGAGVITSRTISASQAGSYNYIH